MQRVPIEVGVVLYRQTPSASWSLDVHSGSGQRERYSLKTTDLLPTMLRVEEMQSG
jgi:hypothetical protein